MKPLTLLVSSLILILGLVGCEKRDICTQCHDTGPRIVIQGFPTLEPEVWEGLKK